MTTKELLKKEIDELSEEQAEKTYKIVKELKREINNEKKKFALKAFPMGKELDLIDIRKAAYEE